MSNQDPATSSKLLSDLVLTEGNPRVLSQPTSETMDRTIDEFGSLDGIIFNEHLGELVGGNQRTIKFRKDPDAHIVITHTYVKGTDAGTQAVGYVETGGERWPYRIVRWPSAKHRRAVYAANKVHADWDTELAMSELSAMEPEDLPDTGFSLDELERLQTPTTEEPPEEQQKDTAKRFTKEELKNMASVHFSNGGPNDVNQFVEGLPT